ncbi:MAG: hypothetical protein ACHP7N_12745 [Caulobacterales bacterium]
MSDKKSPNRRGARLVAAISALSVSLGMSASGATIGEKGAYEGRTSLEAGLPQGQRLHKPIIETQVSHKGRKGRHHGGAAGGRTQRSVKTRRGGKLQDSVKVQSSEKSDSYIRQ